MRPGWQGLLDNLPQVNDDFLNVTGRGLFCAWIGLVMAGRSLVLSNQEAPFLGFWAMTLASEMLACLLLIGVAGKKAHLFRRASCSLIATALMVAGMLFSLSTNWLGAGAGLIGVLGCVLMAVGNAWFVVSWGLQYVETDRRRMPLHVAGCMIVASVFYYVGYGVPGPVRLAIVFALPALSCLCLLLLSHKRGIRECGESVDGQSARIFSAEKKTYVSYALFLVLFSAVPRFVYQTLSNELGSSTVPGLTGYLFLVSLVVNAGFLIRAASGRREVEVADSVFLILIVLSLGMVCYVLIDVPFVGYSMVSGGYALFDLLSTIAIFSLGASNRAKAVPIICLGRVLTDAGLLVGALSATMYGDIAAEASSLSDVFLIALTLLVVVTFLLLHFLRPARAVSPSNKTYMQTVVEQGRQWSLTEREAELLGYIAQGRSISYAAKEMNIANSTAASHLERIYRKMGVTNKQDALDVLHGSLD